MGYQTLGEILLVEKIQELIKGEIEGTIIRNGHRLDDLLDAEFCIFSMQASDGRSLISVKAISFRNKERMGNC